MKTPNDRIQLIKNTLQKNLQPSYLKIIDDSHKHIGHAGAQSGLGHFSLEISADIFHQKKPLECHRLIYQALGHLMQTDIHALKIKIVS